MPRAASLPAAGLRGRLNALRARLAAALAEEEVPDAPRLAWFPCGPEILPLAGLMWFPDLVAAQVEKER
jgi:hypothetical protein